MTKQEAYLVLKVLATAFPDSEPLPGESKGEYSVTYYPLPEGAVEGPISGLRYPRPRSLRDIDNFGVVFKEICAERMTHALMGKV